MYLYELALQVAKAMMDVHEGTATEVGTSTTLVDDELKYPADYFKGGTLWIKTGNNIGAYRVVSNTPDGEIKFKQ